jgi:pimeloyl-ACP methyl ester carboxylesterase
VAAVNGVDAGLGVVEPSSFVASADGTQIATYEFGGDGPVVLIAHATGLCGAAYGMMAAELAAEHRVVGLDFRGHGRSSLPASGDLSWDRMAEDLTAVARTLPGPIHGFGHSMGGAALLLAETASPCLLSSLYLFEPIVLPDDVPIDGENHMGEAARRRRNAFASSEEVLLRYALKPPFNAIAAGCAAAYVANGFARDADGVVRLRCSPETEGQVFDNSRASTLRRVRHVSLPTVVAVGREEDGPSPARYGPTLADTLVEGRLMVHGHLGHFGPLQDPWSVAQDVSAHLHAVA